MELWRIDNQKEAIAELELEDEVQDETAIVNDQATFDEYNRFEPKVHLKNYTEAFNRSEIEVGTVLQMDEQLSLFVQTPLDFLDTLKPFLSVNHAPYQKDGRVVSVRTQLSTYEQLSSEFLV